MSLIGDRISLVVKFGILSRGTRESGLHNLWERIAVYLVTAIPGADALAGRVAGSHGDLLLCGNSAGVSITDRGN